MISSNRGKVEIHGNFIQCMTEYTQLTKYLILAAPEEEWENVAQELKRATTEGIILALKGGEEDEEP